MNLLYSLPFRGQDAEQQALEVHRKIRDAVIRGTHFPFNCPYEVGVARSRASHVDEWIVAILALRGVLLDDNERAETVRRIETWLNQAGGIETRNATNRPADHLKLSSEFGLEYEFIDSFGTFVGEPDLESAGEPIKKWVEPSAPKFPPTATEPTAAEMLAKIAGSIVESPAITPGSEARPATSTVTPPANVHVSPRQANTAITCLGAALIGIGALVGIIGLLFGLLLTIGTFSDPTGDMTLSSFVLVMACFPLPAIVIGAVLIGLGIFMIWRLKQSLPWKES